MNEKWTLAIATMLVLAPLVTASQAAGWSATVNAQNPADTTCVLGESDEMDLVELPAPGESVRITIPFRSAVNLSFESIEDAAVSYQSCSSGVCTVIIHVYEETITHVTAHAGMSAFLSQFYGSLAVAQEVQVDKETEIHCEGSFVIVGEGSGGPGPRYAASSIYTTATSYTTSSCGYLNVPYDESCLLTHESAFDVSARLPGVVTRFDVVTGGKWANELAVQAAVAHAKVHLGGNVSYSDGSGDVETSTEHPLPFDEAGRWQTNLAGIDIQVDATA